MATTLIITNDFPPRVGGIESFVGEVVRLLDQDVVVYTSSTRGSSDADARLGVEVVRGAPILLPTPGSTRQAIEILRRTGATRVLFGAAAPLGLMAPSLRRAGAERIVGLSHGHETWWASVPGPRAALRVLADQLDHLSTISDFTAARIAPALSTGARERMIRLAPPVDIGEFRPAQRSPATASRRPRVVAVGRLVHQKGFDTLLRAWRLVQDNWKDANRVPELVLVGDGPRRGQLEAAVTKLGLAGHVQLTGSLPRNQVVEQLQHADVFALPMRTRWAGLNPEGLGLASIEAASCALPVIVGNSGGAPETLLEGISGYVVDPEDAGTLAARLGELLRQPAQARSMGAAGRRFVAAQFGTEQARRTLRSALALP